MKTNLQSKHFSSRRGRILVGEKARPHPGPLPRGEGESPSALGDSLKRSQMTLHLHQPHLRKQTADNSPSPGGEGGLSELFRLARIFQTLPALAASMS